MFTDMCMPICIWVWWNTICSMVHRCRDANWSDFLRINWLVGWILHKESGARWTVWSCKCFIYLGWHSSRCWVKEPKFESNVSKTIEILFTWMLNLITNRNCNKAENFQWILWTRQSVEWGNIYSRPVLSPFWEAHDLDLKDQAPLQGSC